MPNESSSSANTAAVGVLDAATLRALLANDDEIAFIDVREHGQYGEDLSSPRGDAVVVIEAEEDEGAV